MHGNNNEPYNPYNVYNLEPQFKLFLVNLKKSASTVKNYLSDFRHFTGWLIANIKPANNIPINDLIEFIKLLTPQSIRAYRGYLLKNGLPERTINRRLSTVRIFCTFCLSQGWLKFNPSSNIGNITSNHVAPEEKDIPLNEIIDKEFEQFSSELQSTDSSDSSDIDLDVKDFIEFIKKK